MNNFLRFTIISCLMLFCSCKDEGVLLPESATDPRDSSTIKMAEDLVRVNASITAVQSNYKNMARSEMFRNLAKSETGIEQLTLELRSEYELMLAGYNREALIGFDRIDSIARAWGLASNQNVYRMTNSFRAIANMRIGEVENCQLNHNESSCIIPFDPKSFHIKEEGSQNAIKLYTDLINQQSDLNFIWVLNIAYMTLGQYPGSVPPQWLIPLIRSEEAGLISGKFTNVADKLGIDDNRLAGGVVIEDFDNDMDMDIMVSSWSLDHQVFYYENDGNGNYKNVYKQAGIEGITGGLNMTHGDYNNDGFLDVFIPRGAWLPAGLYPNSLLRNNGDGSFTDVTREAGIYSLHPTQNASWADFNNDGWLDIFVGNETTETSSNPCELWLNDGTGKFNNVAAQVGANIISFIKGSCTSDYDNDGDQDLFLSNMSGNNYLLRNDTSDSDIGFKFTDISKEAGIELPHQSFPCWFFDINNDGWDDLYISGFPYSAYNHFAEEYAKELLGQENTIEKPKVYINDKKGGFIDRTEEYGLNTTCYTMGSSFGDINNDGYLDFYLGTGEPDFKALVPNRMFLNINGRTFKEVTTQGGFGHIQKGHAISFADIDNDGDEDVYAVMGGAYEGDVFYNALFLNPGNDNNWVKLKLEGTKSNRAAYGAKVELQLDSPNGRRSIYRTISSGSSFGENPNMMNFGFLPEETIKAINIHWPSGYVQALSDIDPKRYYHIKEGTEPKSISGYQKIKLDLSKNPHHHH